jgi:hypothetical protein
MINLIPCDPCEPDNPPIMMVGPWTTADARKRQEVTDFDRSLAKSLYYVVPIKSSLLIILAWPNPIADGGTT